MERTILVTGGAGYIGSHFIRTYLERRGNDRLLVLDDLSSGHIESLPKSSQVAFTNAKLADKTTLTGLFSKNKISAVVHFAGKICVGESQTDPFLYFRNNVLDSISLFEVMELCEVRRIVFSSSASVYGQPKYSPLDESHPLAPTSVYGTTKLMAEQILQSLTDSSGWSSVSLRYFNAAGAAEASGIGESHNPETHLIPNLLMAALGQNKEMMIHGSDYPTKDGTCVRDYIHVTDLAVAHCQALDLLMEKALPTAHALNLGTSIGASVLEILSIVEEITQTTILKKIGNRRPGDPAYLIANAAKAERLLGWHPKHDLRKTIATAWLWHKNRLY